MAQTKQSIRNEWNKRNLKSYAVNLHKTYNADLIQYVERKKQAGEKTSDIFKAGIERLMENENGQ